ncbi:hypothetical protein EVAR_87200_1 [Eumeta japonica]|uniref:Uncharacterized protein n=1 Tax=Eumeta variegata TaxID=151549 RepID=A0A4C1VWP7_EUMVA|nr:hypothetical protein EVAR_87200_1 [Eumeta japonica]
MQTALSRIEINNDEANSMAVNPSEKPPSLSNSSTLTAHTSTENPILEIPISDEPLNKFNKHVVITVVGDIKKWPVVTKPFETHTRTSIQLSESNIKIDTINAIKEYVNPKTASALRNLLSETPARCRPPARAPSLARASPRLPSLPLRPYRTYA